MSTPRQNPLRARGVMVVVVFMTIAAVFALPVEADTEADTEIDKSGFASVNGRAVAAGVHTVGDAPGFLPVSPLAEVGVGWALAEMNIAQNHSQASPVFPGNVVLGLPGVLALLGLPLPVAYPLVAETFYPPGGEQPGGQVPDLEVPGAVSLRGLHNASKSSASAASADSAVGKGNLAGGLIRVDGVESSSQVVLSEGGPRVEAQSAIARAVVADQLELKGLAASASDDAVSQATGELAVASCTIADVRCEVTPDGIVITDTSVPAPIAAMANQALAQLAEQGIDVRLGELSVDDAGARAAAVLVRASIPIEPPAAAGVPQQTLDVTFELGHVSASSAAVALEPFEPAALPEPLDGGGSGASEAPLGSDDDASAVPSPGTSDGTSPEPSVASPSPTGEPEIAAPQPVSQTPAQVLIGRVARMPDGLLLLFGALVVIGSLALVFVPRRSLLR